jgi:hypothetical protein
LDPAYRPVRLETSLEEIAEISRVRISSSSKHELMLLQDAL